MAIDKNFVDQFIKVTSKAALSSSYLVGKKDKIAADKAAVDSMRSELNKMNIQGNIVIGEGELDEAPMLFIGEKVGNKNGPELDIAVDPLEGTNFAANNLPGALSVIAISEKNNLLNAPETYMEKITSRVTEKNVIDLDYSVKKNISNLSDYLNKNPQHKSSLNKLSKEELNKIFLPLKGIGPWTINIMQMFYLEDKDIWLPGDLGIQKSFKYFFEDNNMDEIQNLYKPYRTYFCLYLWSGLSFVNKN